MSDEIPKNTKNTEIPYKQDIYAIYVIWKSIPVAMRHGSLKKIRREIGIEDPEVQRLAKIRTQSEFAKEYDIEPSTLSNWNKLIKKRKPVVDSMAWAKDLTKNVLFTVYRNAVEKQKLGSIRLFFQIVCNWDGKGPLKDWDVMERRIQQLERENSFLRSKFNV